VTFREFFSLKGVFTVRNVVVMGLMTAIAAILGALFNIFATPTFKIFSLTYLPGVIVAMLFGPWASVLYGFASDFVVYIVNPQGGYFPGFAISEIVSCLIHAFFLYKREFTITRISKAPREGNRGEHVLTIRTTFTITRVIAARLVNLVVVLMGLNFVWLNMMYGQSAGTFFTGARLVNNLIQFPLHVILILLVGRQIYKLRSRGLI
jgi:ECF transporter S component (folate family)